MRRYFTLEEANALVPKVSATMDRAFQLHVLLRQRMSALRKKGTEVDQAVLMGRPPEKLAPGTELELEQARALYQAILDELRTIEELGAEVKGVQQGLVDFWSLLDGKTEVLLCWKLGEPRIDYFHRPEDGFDGRETVEGRAFLAEPRRPH